MVFCCTDYAVAVGEKKLAWPLVLRRGILNRSSVGDESWCFAKPADTLHIALSKDADRPQDDKYCKWNSQ